MRSSILLCVTVVVALCSPAGTSVPAAWANQPAPPPLAAAADEDGAWPMAGANPQRTSWTSEEVSGQLAIDWYRPVDPYIPGKVQVIAASNTIFLSTARGLYAFDPATGAQRWVYATELPLGHSPTVSNGVAYVGGFDHRLHAVDISNGQRLWTYDGARAGYDTNPLVVDNLVIAGNRDGGLYAVYANDHPSRGQLAWKLQTGGPIHFSAAYKDGTVYVASDDSYVYAINGTNGSLIWKSDTDAGEPGNQKLPITGFHSWWPVVYTNPLDGRDYVVLVGPDNYRYVRPFATYGLQNLDADDFLYPVYGSQGDIGPRDGQGRMNIASAAEYFEEPTASQWQDDPAGRNRGDHKPWRRTVFVLDANTGLEEAFDIDNDGRRDYAPVFWWGTRTGMRFPPIVGGDGRIYLTNTYSVNGLYSTRGQVVGWDMGTPYITTPASGTQASDEPMAYSAGGNVIYWNLCCDRAAGALTVDGSSNWTYFSYNLDTLAPGYNIKSYGSDEANAVTVYGDSRPGTGWDGQAAGWNGVYGLHGDENPPVPYMGRVYMHRGNALIAFAPGDPRGEALPLAATVDASEPPSPVDVEMLKQTLAAEVEKILAAGHLRPGYGIHGYLAALLSAYNEGDDFADYFHTTLDTVYALSIAYPYLSTDLQLQVRDYLASEMSTYSPCEYRHNGWQGASRDSLGPTQAGLELPPEAEEEAARIGASEEGNYSYEGWEWPPHLFYALWKYAEIAGNAETLFNSCRSRLGTVPGNSVLLSSPEAHNAWIAGLRGYVELDRLANHLGSIAQSSRYTEYASILEQRAVNFSQTINSPLGPDHHDARQAWVAARNFMFMTPELADYLESSPESGEAVRTSFDLFDSLVPYWMASKFEATYGESIVQPLYDVNALFSAKAWILNASREDLARYLDGPAFVRGDLFYIQNLVMTIDAPSDAAPQTFADVPPSHPFYREIEALYQAGYTAGCSTDPLMYCPENTMNRAESAVFVERGIHGTSGLPSQPATQTFADLPLDSWAAKWAEALWQDQYTAGCGSDPLVYCPWQGHTRAEGCVFYLHMLNGPTFAPPQPSQQMFADVPLDTWYAKWVQAGYDAGLIAPCQTTPDLRFCPDDPLSRALAAYMMVQAKGLQ